LLTLSRKAPAPPDLRGSQPPFTEEVRKKDEANFCDHFKPKEGAYVAKNTTDVERAKSALEDLFRK
jgi:hypothetical protein